LSCSIVWVEGLVASGLSVTEDFTLIHGETSSASTETNTLWSKLPPVALLTVDISFMFCTACAVQPLQTESTVEADLVPLLTTGEDLFGMVDDLAAFWATTSFAGGFERHSVFLDGVTGYGRTLNGAPLDSHE